MKNEEHWSRSCDVTDRVSNWVARYGSLLLPGLHEAMSRRISQRVLTQNKIFNVAQNFRATTHRTCSVELLSYNRKLALYSWVIEIVIERPSAPFTCHWFHVLHFQYHWYLLKKLVPKQVREPLYYRLQLQFASRGHTGYPQDIEAA